MILNSVLGVIDRGSSEEFVHGALAPAHHVNKPNPYVAHSKLDACSSVTFSSFGFGAVEQQRGKTMNLFCYFLFLFTMYQNPKPFVSCLVPSFTNRGLTRCAPQVSAMLPDTPNQSQQLVRFPANSGEWLGYDADFVDLHDWVVKFIKLHVKSGIRKMDAGCDWAVKCLKACVIKLCEVGNEGL